MVFGEIGSVHVKQLERGLGLGPERIKRLEELLDWASWKGLLEDWDLGFGGGE